MCDQVEGFRTYLATAEADQLKFEEGEDIFSKYLPWAIIFELADRWAKIWGDLVTMGRLPNQTPYWYIGNYQMAAFNTAFLTSSLTSAAHRSPHPRVRVVPASAVVAPSAQAASPEEAAEEAAAAAGEFRGAVRKHRPDSNATAMITVSRPLSSRFGSTVCAGQNGESGVVGP